MELSQTPSFGLVGLKPLLASALSGIRCAVASLAINASSLVAGTSRLTDGGWTAG